VNKTHIQFVCEEVNNIPVTAPIYARTLAVKLGKAFHLEPKKAAAATATAVKRILDGKLVPDFRFFQKGIYYRTVRYPLGDAGIDVQQLIIDKYLFPDIGYETGYVFLNHIGLTTQMPNKDELATNNATRRKNDVELRVWVRPAKIKITAENKRYLQLLDALELMDDAPVDEKEPYLLLANLIQQRKLDYKVLLALAERYYPQKVVLKLARTAAAQQEGRG